MSQDDPPRPSSDHGVTKGDHGRPSVTKGDQSLFNWGGEAVRKRALRAGLTPVQADLLCVLQTQGEGLQQPVDGGDDLQLMRLECSERTLAGHSRYGRTALSDAAVELEQLGLLSVQRFTRPWTYLFCVSRLKLMPDADEVSDESVAEFSTEWSPMVAALRVRERVKNSSVSRASVPVSVVRGTVADQRDQLADDGFVPTQPWGTLTPLRLQAAVLELDTRGRSPTLESLFHEACRAGHLREEDAEAERLFLAAAHHCAHINPDKLHSANQAAVLTSRIKRRNFRNLQESSLAWADQMRARRRAQQRAQLQQPEATAAVADVAAAFDMPAGGGGPGR